RWPIASSQGRGHRQRSVRTAGGSPTAEYLLPSHSAACPEAHILAEKERSSVALDRGRGIVTLKIRPAAAGRHADIAALLRTPGSARTDFGTCEDAVAAVLSIVRERADRKST